VTEKPSGPAAAAPEAPGSITQGTAEEGKAYDFALPSLDGSKVRLADSAGRVRLIDFWATWCAPCVEEIPMLNDLHRIYAEKGLTVIAISEEDPEAVRKFVTQHGVLYQNLLDDAEVSQKFGVLGLPSTVLVDREGKVVESYFGVKPRKILEGRIVELLGQPS
jgi:peroxiredoxin